MAPNMLDVLPANYGYVLLTGTGATMMGTYFGMKVGRARTKYEVQVPEMYSDSSPEFNCVQRVHQNYLERYPTLMFLLLTGGLESPKAASAAGALYLLSRAFYSKGYTSGDPKKRVWGAWGHIMELVLLGTTIRFALRGCKKMCSPF